MPMGSSACFDEVIEDKFIKKILGKDKAKKLNQFKKLFEKLEEDEGASSLIEYLTDGNPNAVSDDEDKNIQKLDSLWTEIKDTVKANTSIDLEVCYHDSDDGDCYDEVEGLYFAFSHNQLYKPTPALKRLKERFGDEVVERKFYTVFC